MRSMLRLPAAAAAAVALLTAGSSSAATGSGVYGTVRKGPVKPVCRVGVPCDAPAQVTLVFSRATPSPGSTTVHVTVRTTSGRYRVALDPGFWNVSATAMVGMSRLPRPHAIHVRAGRWDRINLFFDTGIR